jgi:general secretion pathway protein D
MRHRLTSPSTPAWRPGAGLTVLSLCAALLWVPLPLQAQKPGEPITLNFVNADIEAVARTLASLTGRQLVVDPRVKGTLTLSTDKPVAASVAWNQFLAALRLQSFSVVEANGLYKIVPEADAKLQAGPVNSTPMPAAGGQIQTQIFRLQHENANHLVAVLRPLISPNNTINVTPGTNALVITDYADNLQRLGRIIATLDLPAATDVEVIPLKHAIAIDLAPLVTRLLETGGSAPGAAPAAGATGPDTQYKTTLIPETRTNSLILRAANPARLAQVRSLVEKLDQPGSSSASGNLHVVYLKNAEATRLANTLRAAMQSQGTMGAIGAGTPTTGLSTPATPGTAALSTAPMASSGAFSGSGANVATTGGQIQADPATNSLIITAPEPLYRQLRAIIDQLDGRRAQVLVESLIAEVDVNKAAQFGIQWQNVMGQKGGTVGIMGTNFGSDGNNLLNLSLKGASGTVMPGSGLNVATASQVNGVYVLNSLANFLQTNGDSNILSTPTLLTLDNEEAKIVVGQNVPFVTGQYTNNNTVNGAVNPFQTIERRDVGLTLRVKPQISETGNVKLTIYQEVSSVVASSVGATSGLITNKRSIESNVLVQDGSIVVLGGLLADEYANNAASVPWLSSIPYLGALFRNESRERKKTNLMVFLRPVVLRDVESTDALSGTRYQQMLGAQQASQSPDTPVLPVPNTMTLPPLPSRPATAAPGSSGTPPGTPDAARVTPVPLPGSGASSATPAR